MILIDIGNTNIVIGIIYKEKFLKISRINTKDFNKTKLKNEFNKISKKYNKYIFNKCILSSVVSNLDKKVVSFFNSIKIKVFKINYSNINMNLKYNVKNPYQVGNDRIANCIASMNKYGKNCLVIDFGTATTFDVLKNNIYCGGIISPGIEVSHNALVNNASKLSKISIKKINKRIVGKSTVSAMESGFYWGYVSLINGLIKKIIKEQQYRPKIILTGGLAKIFRKEIKYKHFIDINLTLYGLYLIGKRKYAE